MADSVARLARADPDATSPRQRTHCALARPTEIGVGEHRSIRARGSRKPAGAVALTDVVHEREALAVEAPPALQARRMRPKARDSLRRPTSALQTRVNCGVPFSSRCATAT